MNKSQHKQWGEAQQDALAKGGYLLALETTTEMAAVKALAAAQNITDDTWIGLSFNIEKSGDNITANKWEWSNGEALANNSTMWQSNNTWNNAATSGYLTYSKGMWRTNNDYFRNDHPEDHGRYYIIEYDNSTNAPSDITFTVDATNSSSAVKGTDYTLSKTSYTLSLIHI